MDRKTFYRTSETFVGGSRTLPGEFYTSEALYQTELERIFFERWVCAGRSREISLPGDYYLRQVGRESLILLRDQGRMARCFYNVCRHRGTRICMQDQGRFSASLQCPYHAWTYNLQGELIGAPMMDQVEDFEKADYPLHAIATHEWEGFIFINLVREPEPFSQAFAPVLDKFSAWDLPDLDVAGRIEYEVKANWKLIVQNYSECYHCPLVHPDLASKTPYLSGQNDLFEGPFLGGYMDLTPECASLTVSGRACAAPLGSVSGEDVRRVYYYAIFPNLLLSLHPDYVMYHTLWPVRPDLTLVRCEWMFAPQAIERDGFDAGDAIRFWDLTNRQDWEMCERSQLGVSSRAYTRAPYSGQESLLAAFDREVLRSLGMDPAENRP